MSICVGTVDMCCGRGGGGRGCRPAQQPHQAEQQALSETEPQRQLQDGGRAQPGEEEAGQPEGLGRAVDNPVLRDENHKIVRNGSDYE